MRVLLIGGSGQLGTEIRRSWTGDDVLTPSHGELDLELAPAMREAIERNKPDAVVNCAAFHNVDRCEELPERAFSVNAIAVDRAARICREFGAKFVTISTDYVFDGEAGRPYGESDAPHPISAYGVSKYAGELLVDRLRSNALVVRTCGVYGVRPSASKGYAFVDRVIAQARAGDQIRIVNDVVASPTFAGDLARMLRRLIEAGSSGLYHAANEGAVSWFDFAAEALRQAGIDYPIEPISQSVWKTAARRPRFSALANRRLGAMGMAMPSWQDGIAEYLRLSRLSETANSP